MFDKKLTKNELGDAVSKCVIYRSERLGSTTSATHNKTPFTRERFKLASLRVKLCLCTTEGLDFSNVKTISRIRSDNDQDTSVGSCFVPQIKNFRESAIEVSIRRYEHREFCQRKRANPKATLTICSQSGLVCQTDLRCVKRANSRGPFHTGF